MASRRRERLLRRLHLRLSMGWSAAWLLGVAVLCALAIVTHAQLRAWISPPHCSCAPPRSTA